MAPKKVKSRGGKESSATARLARMAPPKPKKIPPPPACFTSEDLARFKDVFKLHDETNLDKVPVADVPVMLRRLGFNPKPTEIQQLYERFLEDELVDTVEYHEFLLMIEAKIALGDDFEAVLVDAMRDLGHDDATTGFVDFELFRQELASWGEPLQEREFAEWLRLAAKDKTYNPEDGKFCFAKFIENMNAKDERFFKEPINFFKLDQRTLAEMAIKKAQEEKLQQEKREAEKREREEARRLKLIEAGALLPPQQ